MNATEGVKPIYVDFVNESISSINISSNINHTNLEQPNWYISSSAIIFLSFEMLLAVVGTVANAVVVWIIARSREMRTYPNIFVLNLEIVDALFCYVYLLLKHTIILPNNQWTVGRPICTVQVAVMYIGIYSSIMFLTAMSIKRYQAVTDTMAHRTLAASVPEEGLAHQRSDMKLRTKGIVSKLRQGKIQPRNRMTRMVIVVVLAFILSWLPYHLYSPFIYFSQEADSRYVNHIIEALYSSNSTGTPEKQCG
ncbi:chemokine XC receptor 1-like [Branchiostoma lanceolatum]|uniref:chemokine XC receptor 1-like n=1 Tax=Branchiostoma lanceolatum TaxID=7740 RepID=UPI0034558CB2